MPLVIRAYLEGNRTLLKEHCAPEMLERLSGLISAQQAQARLCQALAGSHSAKAVLSESATLSKP